MVISNRQKPHQDHEEEEEEEEEDYSTESERSDSDCDSDTDLSYSIMEDARSKFSSLSIRKKSKSRFKKDPDEVEKNLAEVDGKSYEQVEKIIQAGKLEELKVEQCKVYLRKNGLRLTGNKDILIQRIKEHQQILNGGGEKKFPISSFVLDCKGDACTGDVVMFEQKVYETYNIASRSASGPPCGSRIVAGRIVKDSYGAAKQQHTFTIEVLWSKGHKPHPPLHPLLIKGRNLYRLKTLRQRWEDEGQRRKVLMEKHSRGFLARSNRETRIQDKGRRKMLREIRALEKDETNKSQSQVNFQFKTNMRILAHQGRVPRNSMKCNGIQEVQQHRSSESWKLGIHSDLKKDQIDYGQGRVPPNSMKSSGIQDVQQHRRDDFCSSSTNFQVKNCKYPCKTWNEELSKRDHARPLKCVNHYCLTSEPPPLHRKPLTSMDHSSPMRSPHRQSYQQPKFQKYQRENDYRNQVPYNSVKCSGIENVDQHRNDYYGPRSQNFYMNDGHSPVNKYSCTNRDDGLLKRNYHSRPLTSTNQNRPMSPPTPHGRPLTSMNHSGPLRSPHRQSYRQGYQQVQQLCRYYAQGRCYYGDNCKYLHELPEISDQEREERWLIAQEDKKDGITSSEINLWAYLF